MATTTEGARMPKPEQTETVECAYCPAKFVKPTSQRKRFCSDKCKRGFTSEAYQIGSKVLEERKNPTLISTYSGSDGGYIREMARIQGGDIVLDSK